MKQIMSGKEMNAANLLGLAQKAGKLIYGEDDIARAVRKKKAAIIIVAEDASEGTKKSYINMAEYYTHAVLVAFLTKEELGHCVGKPVRAAIAIGDKGFARAFTKLIAAQEI